MSLTGLPPARSPGAPPPPAALRLRGTAISKTYKSQRALNDVELALQPGELHGLVGQNGSGKSTLMKILSGYHAPDTGARLELDGVPVQLPVRVPDLRRHGIAVVHQSLGLIGEFSALDNIRAGRWRGARWSRRIQRRHEEEQAISVLERLGQSVDLDRPVAQLSAESRATVAIARALQDYEPGRGVILLDEATRALTRPSLAHFYELLRAVMAEGASVVLVSHRLEEVLGACDRITVLRDGEVVAPAVPDRRTRRVEADPADARLRAAQPRARGREGTGRTRRRGHGPSRRHRAGLRRPHRPRRDRGHHRAGRLGIRGSALSARRSVTRRRRRAYARRALDRPGHAARDLGREPHRSWSVPHPGEAGRGRPGRRDDPPRQPDTPPGRREGAALAHRNVMAARRGAGDDSAARHHPAAPRGAHLNAQRRQSAEGTARQVAGWPAAAAAAARADAGRRRRCEGRHHQRAPRRGASAAAAS